MAIHRMTLREYAELEDRPRAFTACSASIDPSGQIPVDTIRKSDWWITSEGRSFSCTPDTEVRIYTREAS